jgi:hypothetical protein
MNLFLAGFHGFPAFLAGQQNIGMDAAFSFRLQLQFTALPFGPLHLVRTPISQLRRNRATLRLPHPPHHSKHRPANPENHWFRSQL